MSRRVLVIGGSLLGLLLLVATGAFALATVRGDEVVPGVSVEGTDLGGLGREDAHRELEQLAAARAGEPVVLTHEGDEFTVDPVEVGAAVDIDALVDAAFDAGRTGAFLGDRLTALTGTDVELELDVELDQEALASRIAEIAAEVDTPVFPGDITVDPVTLEVAAQAPEAGVATRQDAAAEAVIAAFDQPGPETLDLPVDVVQPDTDQADVDSVAADARSAIAEDLVLTSSDGSITLAPREVAALLAAEQVGEGARAELRLVVTPDAVQDVLEPLAGPLLRDARDAGYDVPRTPPVTFDEKFDTSWSAVPADVTVVDGRTGTQVEPELAAEALSDAVRSTTRELTLPLAEFPPDFSTEQAREQRPTHLLSTFTTYHACCQTRVHNIQRLADMVDGALVLPGEQFSVNQISGVRECSKGFRPAGMILDGEIVDSCGGGVSQFGTTTVNAVFFAGLDPDAYKPHSFYISRYPMAREATLNYPSPDLDVKFTNDTGNPILVRTSHTSTSITVSFYGSSDVAEVRADVGSPTNIKPYPTERRVNRSLPPGAQRQVQGGRDGFYVTLTRTIVYEGGETTTDDWSNAYVPETEIIEYNPDKPKPKEPEPDETPSET